MTAIIDFNTVCQYARIVHYSQMFGTKSEYEAAIIVAMCFQENISFMQFKRDFHFYMGNITKKADAMLASFQADGGKKKIIQADENKVIIDFEINGEKYQGVADWEKLQHEPFTHANKDANGKFYAPNVPLVNRLVKDNYATPIKRGQMLFARCVSDSLRRIWPKACGGYYTPEEVGDFAEDDNTKKDYIHYQPLSKINEESTQPPTDARHNQPLTETPQDVPPSVDLPKFEKPAETSQNAPKPTTEQTPMPPQNAPQNAPIEAEKATPPTPPQNQSAPNEDYTICRIPNAPTHGMKWNDMETKWLEHASTKLPISQYFTIHDLDYIKAILEQRNAANVPKADN